MTNPDPNKIILVSGLPRSGTSMMMQMLEAGGIALLTDQHRAPDADNPQGYYELQAVKRSKQDTNWVAQAPGKAVKVISFYLPDLPRDHPYSILFMRRPLDKILASQKTMLKRQGKPDDLRIGPLFQKHLDHIIPWLTQQLHMNTHYIEYEEILATPDKASIEIAEFLNISFDTSAMASAVMSPRQ